MTEHCLGALAGLGVHNAIVELDGPELPILDGSALPVVECLVRAGFETQGAPVHQLRITSHVIVRDGGASIVGVPSKDSHLRIRYNMDYGSEWPALGASVDFRLSVEEFCRSIAPARSYLLEHEVASLQREGVLQQETVKIPLVVYASEKQPVWRVPSEPARHKILDLLGDLSLVGSVVEGTVVATRSGHALNQSFVRVLSRAFGPSRPANGI